MLAVRKSLVLSVTPRFLAVRDGVRTELSKVMERSWVRESFPGRKRSSVLSRLIVVSHHPLRDVRDLCCYPVSQMGEKTGLVGYHQHSYGRKSE